MFFRFFAVAAGFALLFSVFSANDAIAERLSQQNNIGITGGGGAYRGDGKGENAYFGLLFRKATSVERTEAEGRSYLFSTFGGLTWEHDSLVHEERTVNGNLLGFAFGGDLGSFFSDGGLGFSFGAQVKFARGRGKYTEATNGDTHNIPLQKFRYGLRATIGGMLTLFGEAGSFVYGNRTATPTLVGISFNYFF